MDIDIIAGLESIPNLELLALYYDLKRVIEDKEIDDEIILNAIKETQKKYGYISSDRIFYDEFTLFLENLGYDRETISRKVLNLIRKDIIGWVQSWSSKIHPKYEGKEYYEIGSIFLTGKTTINEKYILEKEKEKLYELSLESLVELQSSIKDILNKRELDTDTLSYVIKRLCKYFDHIWVRYTVLTLFLEKAGFKRESVTEELINMVRKGKIRYSTDWPWPEEKETPVNPIVPKHEGKIYPIVHIFC